ncbi:MAG: hypothetical protein BRC36_04745, partial [Cyanobacteria bacterium QH_2_48_84]
DYAPEQLQLPYPLWTLEAVAELIRQQCGQQLSRQAVSNYLHVWGRSPQKPAKRAREQCPLRRSRLDGAPVPSPAAAGSAGRGQIHAWRRDGPALGPSDRHLLGAQGPDSGCGDHRAALWLQPHLDANQLRHPALSGVRGQFHYRGISGVPAPLGALGATQGVSDCGPPSGGSSPPGAAVGAQHADQIELFYLPPYSPERNPDEYLNQAGLKRMVRAYLHQLQQWPEKLSHFFWLPQVQDAGL